MLQHSDIRLAYRYTVTYKLSGTQSTLQIIAASWVSARSAVPQGAIVVSILCRRI